MCEKVSAEEWRITVSIRQCKARYEPNLPKMICGMGLIEVSSLEPESPKLYRSSIVGVEK